MLLLKRIVMGSEEVVWDRVGIETLHAIAKAYSYGQ